MSRTASEADDGNASIADDTRSTRPRRDDTVNLREVSRELYRTTIAYLESQIANGMISDYHIAQFRQVISAFELDEH